MEALKGRASKGWDSWTCGQTGTSANESFPVRKEKGTNRVEGRERERCFEGEGRGEGRMKDERGEREVGGRKERSV